MNVDDLFKRWRQLFPSMSETWYETFRKELFAYEGDQLRTAMDRTLADWDQAKFGWPRPSDIKRNLPFQPSEGASKRSYWRRVQGLERELYVQAQTTLAASYGPIPDRLLAMLKKRAGIEAQTIALKEIGGQSRWPWVKCDLTPDEILRGHTTTLARPEDQDKEAAPIS